MDGKAILSQKVFNQLFKNPSMSSREDILKAIKANKPDLQALPELPQFPQPVEDLGEAFRAAAEGVGAQVIEINEWEELAKAVRERYPEAKKIAHQIEGLALSPLDWTQLTDAHDLSDVDVAIIRGEFGVGENAAIWIPETILPERVLPFITQHLVIVLSKEALVWNMHQAYARIGSELPGFGVFISGPSKTADIEQSLVLGAHGARTLMIALVPASQNA
ncbi:MAG: LUD domain-containing protein [Bacteroidota bacterium]